MIFSVLQGSIVKHECDILIVNLFDGVDKPGGATGAVDKAMDGAIFEAIKDEGFKAHLGNTLVIRTHGKIPAKKVVLVGLGKTEDFGHDEALRAAARAGRKCRSLQAEKVASILHGAGTAGLSTYNSAKATTLGTILGCYEFTELKTEDVKKNTIESFTIVELDEGKLTDASQGMLNGEVIGNAVTMARDMINMPSNIITPSYLAKRAEEIADEYGMECIVKDRNAINDSGLGLLAAVARGTKVEPRFIEIKYKSSQAKKTIAIVGKGITFDSGGYSLKPSSSMYGMKDDMSGAASVLSAMKAIGKLKPNVNILALIPATENMIGGNAIHPGDVFKSYAGKTVEVNNTDAEGRLILADAIAYAIKQGVDEVIDLATLTGACVVALGNEMAGLFSNNQILANNLISAGELCGEKLWQLPLYKDYKKALKSDIADLKNTAGREGAAITGALFINSFCGDTPWAHIDLSSSMTKKDLDLAKKGATGAGTGTLIEYLLSSQP